MKVVKLIFSFSGLVFLFTLLTHLANIFNYPAFSGDEGIYSFQGWWLVNFQKLSPYTYWYDHAPFGWLLIGLWQKLTGGPFTFGFSLHSSRIFIVLLVSLTNVLLYQLVKHLTKNSRLALFSCFLFSFTPLNLTYHRQVLLDNIETFWLVLSLLFLFKAKKQSLYFLAAGIFFGLAFLSKEIVMVLLPVMLWGLGKESKAENQLHSRLLWLSSAGFLIGFFPLLAILKGELLPRADIANPVSLLGTIIFQLSRGSSLRPWELGSYFQKNMAEWLRIDFFIMFAGLWSILINIFYKQQKQALFFSLLGLNYLLFLARGGFVLGFYLIPLLAIFSINIGLAINNLELQYHFIKKSPVILIRLLLVLIALFLWQQNKAIFNLNVTKNQKEAVDYIKKTLASDAVMAVDDYAFLDLRLKRNANDKAFYRADWYSKVETDPEVRILKLKNDWRNLDYLMIDDYILSEIKNGHLAFLQQAFNNSQLVREFVNSEENIGGIYVALYKIDKTAPQDMKKENPASIEERVGSLLMIGFEGTTLDENTKTFIKKHYFKNFLLQAKNIQNEQQLTLLIKDLKETVSRARLEYSERGLDVSDVSDVIIAVDQEGGNVNRINFPGFENTSQKDISSPEMAYQIAKVRGEQLKKLGINMNLSPIVEINRIENSYLNRTGRAWLGDKNMVIELSQAMIKGYQDAGIMAVLKHFPGGLGRVVADPHYTLPVLWLNTQKLNSDLKPFEKLTDLGLAKAIMVGHLSYPNQDNSFISSLSPYFINDILKNKIKFKGLIMTDDLGMPVVKDNYSLSEACKQAIKAGADMIMISGNQQDQEMIYEAILEGVKRGDIGQGRLDEAWWLQAEVN